MAGISAATPRSPLERDSRREKIPIASIDTDIIIRAGDKNELPTFRYTTPNTMTRAAERIPRSLYLFIS
jgi:hypothetical protein